MPSATQSRDPHYGGKTFIYVEKQVAMSAFTTTPTDITIPAVGDLVLEDIQILRDGGTATTATNLGVKISGTDGYAPVDGGVTGVVFSEAVANFGANKCFRTGAPTTAAGGWGGGSVVSCGKLRVPSGAKLQTYATGANGAGTGNAKILMKFTRRTNQGYIAAA